MGCGCGKKHEATFEAQSVEEIPRPKGAAWSVVVGTRGGVGMTEGVLEKLESLRERMSTEYNQDVRIVIVSNISFDPEKVKAGFHLVEIPNEPYSWGRAMNLGAMYFRSSPYLLFLHDDVTLPDGLWLRDMEAALVGRAAVAVPRITGASSCPPQLWHEETSVTSFEITEYVSPACLAVRRDVFMRVGMFPDDMDGYEWTQVALQDAVASVGHSTVVVPSVTVHHEGERSYRLDERTAGWMPNMARYTELTGQRPEYKRRPSRVRLPSRLDRRGASHIFIVESDHSVDEFRKRLDGNEAEAVIVDVAASEERRSAFAETEHVAGIVVRYAPAWDTDPIRQGINMAAGRQVTLWDMRVGAKSPVEPVTGPRIRTGWIYAMPQFMEEIHLGYMQHAAVGDTVMTTPGLHAFKRRYPHIRTIVHHGWGAGEVLRCNPDVDELRIYESGEPDLPIETFDMMHGCGVEGCVRNIYTNLGVEDLVEEPRRVRYFAQRDEHSEAVKLLLEELGLPQSVTRLIGVQLHGTWQAKNWKYSADMVRAVAARISDGWYPVVFGTEPERMADVSGIPHVAVTRHPLRIAAAVVGLLDCLVGFDSGLSWLAVALQTPCVTLWGPTNHRGYLLDVENVNLVTIRKRVPEQCKAAAGVSCRETSAGSRCPLRVGVGADCLDEITVEEVMQHIEGMPTWDRPIADRFYERHV